MQPNCALQISFTLVSPHDFLTLDSLNRMIVLEATGAPHNVTYDDSYLEVTRSEFIVQVPIRAIITSCVVDSLLFRKSKIFILYFIGSGQLETEIPSLIQIPRCGYSIQGYEVVSAKAEAMSFLQIDNTVHVDFEANKVKV